MLKEFIQMRLMHLCSYGAWLGKHCLTSRFEYNIGYIFLIGVCCINISVARADSYVAIRLPKGVSVELPKNWVILSDNMRITIDAAVQGVTKGVGAYDASSDLSFAANYFDDHGKSIAIFNVRYNSDIERYQIPEGGKKDVDLKMLDGSIKAGVEKAGSIFGYSVVEWRGTKLVNVGGSSVLLSEYLRTQGGGTEIFCVRNVHFLRGLDSFVATVSFLMSQEKILRPIADYIVKSIHVQDRTISSLSQTIKVENFSIAWPSPPDEQRLNITGGELISYRVDSDIYSNALTWSLKIIKSDKPFEDADARALLIDYVKGYLKTFYSNARLIKDYRHLTSQGIAGHYFQIQAAQDGEAKYSDNFFFVQRGKIWNLSLIYDNRHKESAFLLFNEFINSLKPA